MSEEQRKEERYLYKSKLIVTENDHHYEGHIVDFSYSGLKVKLSQITGLSASSVVNINLIELQKISKKFVLSNLLYKVVRTSANNVLHLQVCNATTLEVCQNFFSILVRNNAKHFTCHPLKEKSNP
ncbi:PilZ domain-containing protein [Psychromonas sp. KJ10-10]|uniref:PilZ domain-containing protein n=1 Tax=Psychromonas sp. KJ10-10 TaxID=3391823 RepID=UPI0039B62AE3